MKESYPLNMDIWKRPGSVKASRVQHVAPTRAIMFEKLGIINTITPVNSTIHTRRRF